MVIALKLEIGTSCCLLRQEFATVSKLEGREYLSTLALEYVADRLLKAHIGRHEDETRIRMSVRMEPAHPESEHEVGGVGSITLRRE